MSTVESRRRFYVEPSLTTHSATRQPIDIRQQANRLYPPSCSRVSTHEWGSAPPILPRLAFGTFFAGRGGSQRTSFQCTLHTQLAVVRTGERKPGALLPAPLHHQSPTQRTPLYAHYTQLPFVAADVPQLAVVCTRKGKRKRSSPHHSTIIILVVDGHREYPSNAGYTQLAIVRIGKRKAPRSSSPHSTTPSPLSPAPANGSRWLLLTSLYTQVHALAASLLFSLSSDAAQSLPGPPSVEGHRARPRMGGYDLSGRAPSLQPSHLDPERRK
ncbi:hypothetical protein B0H14DRAFT_3508516 [Mycena olivaceomarginata]|nr:hypothetical protein B0H14DRAFT_3508516 [Mycena olivaceomarginata]